MMLGCSCAIPGRKMIQQSVRAALRRRRRSCFSCSSRGEQHPSFDCVWNCVSAQSSTGTGIIRTGKESLPLCWKNRRELWKKYSETELITSRFNFTVSNNVHLICPSTAFRQCYQISTVGTKIYTSGLIFLCAHTSRHSLASFYN